MKIDHHTIQQLSTWISRSSVGLLELTTPETSLSLRRDAPSRAITRAPVTREPAGAPTHYDLTAPAAGQPATREPAEAPTRYELTALASGLPATRKPAEAIPPYELTAPTPGIYLDRHPLSAQPLVSTGESVAAGQLVGFLQIRSLLIPLRSAQAGRIVNLPQEPGNRLGYGSVVMRLLAAPGS